MEKKVSVFCTTYNQERYLRDALEGFIKQKTNFEYEIFIYDDASTDNTNIILDEYKRKYPKLFNIYISDHNRWKDKNRRNFLMELKKKYLDGDYIALCEGDDYWIDENKLQTQVDYLDSHKNCMMYIHNCFWENCQDGSTKKGNPFPTKGNISVEQLIMQRNAHPPTASMMFRRELLFKEFFFFDSSVGDYTLILCAAAHGEVFYDDKIMSVYRFKAIGSYTSSMQRSLEQQFFYNIGLIDFLIKYNIYTREENKQIISNKISQFVYEIGHLCFENRLTVKELHNRCRKEGFYYSDDCIKLLESLDKYRYFEDIHYIAEATKKYIQQHEKIVVMGIGNFSQILTKKMNNNGYDICGYAVSESQNGMEKYNGKKVWKLDEIPYDKQEYGVIVGILIRDRQDIIDSLKSAGITDYYIPFDHDFIKQETNYG